MKRENTLAYYGTKLISYNVLYIKGTEAKLNILQPKVTESGKHLSLLQ